jgi:CP family cyanate transporter-like MFS transporter
VPETPNLPLWAGRTIALLGIVLLALSLRSAVAAISPITEQIGRDIELTSVGLGVIGMLPPVFFALSGFIAPPIARKLSLEGALVLAIVVMVSGHLVRAFSGSYAALLIGTALALVGMGLGNVLLPPAVKRYFPDRIGAITAMYATIMSISTALPALLAAPLADSIGWRFSLGVWSGLAIIAIIPWITLLARHRASLAAAAASDDDAVETPAPTIVANLWRSRTAVAITASLAVSAINAYANFAWLPQILTDLTDVTPVVAGSLLALFSFAGLPASIIAPILVARLRHSGVLVYAGVVFFVLGYLGLLLVPSILTWLWVLLIGLGPVLFPVSLVLINARTRGHAGSVALSGFAQGIGYTVGAFGPFLVGVLHDATHNWTIPLGFLLVTALAAIPAAYVLGRPRFVEDELAEHRPR